MKTLFNFNIMLLLTGLVFINSACKETPKEEIEQVKTVEVVNEISDTDFKALWEKIDLMWEKRAPELINNVYADNFTRISPGGKSTSGAELVSEFNAINGAYPDMILNLDDYYIRGNIVVVNWSADGTFSGELIGVKGNEKPFKAISGITVLTIEDGKVVKDDSSWNALEIFLQTGYKITSQEE